MAWTTALSRRHNLFHFILTLPYLPVIFTSASWWQSKPCNTPLLMKITNSYFGIVVTHALTISHSTKKKNKQKKRQRKQKWWEWVTVSQTGKKLLCFCSVILAFKYYCFQHSDTNKQSTKMSLIRWGNFKSHARSLCRKNQYWRQGCCEQWELGSFR